MPTGETGYRYGSRVPLFLDTGVWRCWLRYKHVARNCGMGKGSRFWLSLNFRFVSVPPVERAKERRNAQQ
jgi:hypothetical protein